MRRGISMAVLFMAIMNLAEPTHAANWLKGRVYENHGGTKKPAIGAQVWIVHVGNPDTTLSDGAYQVLVPDAIRFGQTIELYVKRKGWAIATPVGGKVEIKKDLTSDILLSPETSSEFLSPEQLDKLLESLPEKLKSQVKPDGKEGEADPAQVVKEYATDHGLPDREVSVKVEELVKQYEQSDDLGKQCLAAVYRKNLELATTRCKQNATSKVDLLKKKRQEVESLSKAQLKSDRTVEPSLVYRIGGTATGKQFRPDADPRGSHGALFVQAPSDKSTPGQLEEARRQLFKLTEEVVGEFKTTGDTYYANYQFDKALDTYKEGLSYVEKRDLPTIWADMQWLIGLADWQVGIRTEGTAIPEYLSDAVNRYGEAQTVYTMTQFPEAWSAIENNLGIVLVDQGTRTSGEAGTKLLAQAVEAYRAALTIYTKEALPQQWATTQNNLGTVLWDQGTRTSGEAGTKLLAQAVEAYRVALTVRTKESLPHDWAMTQNNLGNVLVDQGTRTSGEAGTKLLAQAVEAYRAALTIYTKEALPQQWATTQNNLGTVLWDQGTRTSGEAGTKLLAQAVEAYRVALTVRTKESLPQDWAMTQNNLGLVLADQGTRTSGEAGTKLLAQAVAAYREALKIRTREHLPQGWARTQNNLAKALLQLEDWQGAVEAYRNVLTLYPDYDEGYVSATALYQEKLFAYPEAFALSQQWLERHPDDLSAQANFAEAHFTTGRFAEAETRTAALLANYKLDPNAGLAMRTLHVATLIALNRPASVPPALTVLRDFVANLPSDIESSWSFEGSKHFIGSEPALAPSRAWLLDLFFAVEEKDAQKRLAALEKVRANFPTMKNTP